MRQTHHRRRRGRRSAEARTADRPGGPGHDAGDRRATCPPRCQKGAANDLRWIKPAAPCRWATREMRLPGGHRTRQLRAVQPPRRGMGNTVHGAQCRRAAAACRRRRSEGAAIGAGRGSFCDAGQLGIASTAFGAEPRIGFPRRAGCEPASGSANDVVAGAKQRQGTMSAGFLADLHHRKFVVSPASESESGGDVKPFRFRGTPAARWRIYFAMATAGVRRRLPRPRSRNQASAAICRTTMTPKAAA